MNKPKLFILLLSFLFSIAMRSQIIAQCVVINEIMINGPGACDGMCSPNTEEWTELYNTCSTPINIGCYVLTDGDYIVSIPQGTIIPPYGFYVIGSINSGGPIDLNIATCNCVNVSPSAPPNPIGILNNTNEQLVLANSSGALQDAVYWGSGDFPLSISSNVAGCPVIVNINLTTINSWFDHLPTPGSDGCSVARKCDGSGTWQQRCGPSISMGISNGTPPVPNFVASDTTLCPGSCINFTNQSTGAGATYTWTFTGASTTASTALNPTSICYPATGAFPVTMTLTNVCGPYPFTKTAYIQVGSIPNPTITASGTLAFCAGNSLILQSSIADTYQWSLNNVAIAGATQQQYTATAAGNYTVQIVKSGCSATSAATAITVNPLPTATVSATGPTIICNTGSTSLTAVAGFASYQWMQGATLLSGETNQNLTVTSAGNYSVKVTDGNGCEASSAATAINFSTGYAVTISGTDTILCEGETCVLTLNTSFPSVLWSSGETTPSISVSNKGTYKVLVSNSAACTGNDSVVIVVNPLPQVDAGNDTFGDCNFGILLDANSNGTSFSWLPLDGLSDPTSLNPIANPKESKQYFLTASLNDCIATDDVTVTVDCGNIYIPNTFSPNGDGHNDIFNVIGNDVGQFELRIFNRWGELVFESKVLSIGWDGNYENLPASSGVYVREIKALNPLGKSLVSDENTHGIITLIR